MVGIKISSYKFYREYRQFKCVSPTVARELEEFVSLQCGTARRADRVEAILKDLDRQLSQLYHEMEAHNDDFGALKQIEKHGLLFSEDERQELQLLFGMYCLETDKRLPSGNVTVKYASKRQQHWMGIHLRSRDPVRREIAELAERRYGLLLHEMMRQSTDRDKRLPPPR